MRHSQALTICLSAPLFASALLLLATLPISTQSVAKELYRWTDEKGVTHYSDTKPEGVDVERRPITVDPAPSAPPASEASAEDGAKDAAAPKLSATPEQCARAAANLAHLSSAPVISIDSDGDGVPEVLDDTGRQAQIDSNNLYIKNYCGTAEVK